MGDTVGLYRLHNHQKNKEHWKQRTNSKTGMRWNVKVFLSSFCNTSFFLWRRSHSITKRSLLSLTTNSFHSICSDIWSNLIQSTKTRHMSLYYTYSWKSPLWWMMGIIGLGSIWRFLYTLTAKRRKKKAYTHKHCNIRTLLLTFFWMLFISLQIIPISQPRQTPSLRWISSA